MIEKSPISFAVIGRVLGIDGKKIYRWYKEVLSGFTEVPEQKKLHEHDVALSKKADPETGEIPTLLVPIFKLENFGEDMCLDDKNISGEGYTVLSNKKTGKIALLAQTTKVDLLCKILNTVPGKILFAVKTISKDMAEGYDWLARTVFLNAIRIDDKFHVLKLGFEALQDVRIRYRQDLLRAEREKRELQKIQQREDREECQKTGKIYRKPQSRTTPPKTYANGDTKKELLARSRYLLFMHENQWTDSQKERAAILFQEYPELKTTYGLMTQFRGFYQTKVGDLPIAKERLKAWYAAVNTSEIDEMMTFAGTVDHHEGSILNYFEAGHTNAYAESLNAQIQRFIQSNQGTNDRDFFHFRLKGYFS